MEAVSDIRRYPVKSMLGEQIGSAELTGLGIPGDRAWALKDEVRGGITGGKRFPKLMAMSARFVSEPDAGQRSPEVMIDAGSGEPFSSLAADANARLSDALEHPISLWPLLPAERDDHTPPGTYFDAYPLLIVSRSAIETLAERAAAAGFASSFDLRRFRPNLVIDSDADGFVEDAWAGRHLAIGEAELFVDMVCPRCIMTTHGFLDLPSDPRIMRALVKVNDGNLGVYTSVVRPGRIRVGDRVQVS